MTVDKKFVDGKTLLELDGRLDTVTAPAFQTQLLDALSDGHNLVLNFLNLVYVSSAGLRSLLVAQKASKAKSLSMMLINVCPEVMDVFKMTGFADILTIE